MIISITLGFNFYDLDVEIEQAEGKTIPRIFEENGEDYFRKVESSCLLKLVRLHDERGAVVSTGGGTPCFFDHMTIMNESGVTLFLDVPQRVLVKRLLSTNLAKRPKFGSEQGLIEHLARLFEARRAFYEKAQFILSGDNISVEELTQVLEKES